MSPAAAPPVIAAPPPAPAAAPPGPPAAPSRFFPGGQTAGGPAVPSIPVQAPAAPAAPVAPAPAAPPAAPAGPRQTFFAPAAAPAQPAAPGTPATAFDPAAFAKQFIADLLPDTFLKSDDPNVKNFGAIREALAKATERATAAEMKVVRAHKDGVSVADQAMRDKLTAAEAKLAEFEPRLGKLTVLEARAELADNDQFAAAYTDKLTSLKNEALAIAKEAGLDAALVDKAFAAESKLGAAKALAAVEDADAKSLLADLARQALETGAKFRSEWKDPVKALETWRARAAEGGVARSAQHSTQAVALHKAAIQSAMQGDPSKGVPANFALAAMLQNPESAAIFGEIEAQYTGNTPIPQGQIFADRVQAATVPHLISYTVHLEQALEAANAKLKEYGALQPGGYASPGQLAGGAPPAGQAGKGLWSFAAPTSGPVIPQATGVSFGGHGAAVPGAQRA